VTMIADDAELSRLADRLFSEPGFDIAVELGAILVRRPDNAQVVLKLRGPATARIVERSLTR